MCQHCGDQPGIVRLDTRYRARHNQPAPLGVGTVGVWQEKKVAFDQLRARISLGTGQAKSVLVGGASAYVPELHEILRHQAELIATSDKGINGRSNAAYSGPAGFKSRKRMFVSRRTRTVSVVILVNALAAKGG